MTKTHQKVDITIDVGKIGNTNQTNAEPIVISIDRAPRIILIGGNSKTEFNKSDLEGINNVISYTFNFSEPIDGLDGSDFVITPADSGVSVQSTTFGDGITEATVTFTVTAGINDDFSIALPDDSYTDDGNNGNREEITELPLNITIDTIAPFIISPVAGDYEVTTQSFTLTIDFSEAIILTSTDIILENATIEESTIDNNGNGGTGRVVIKAMIDDLTGDSYTITIQGSAYSDTLGNVGGNDYTLTIDIEALLLTLGECQNFSFDGGDGSTDTPYQISNICQLQNIADDDITADGVAYTNLLDKSYILTENIDATYTSNWDSGKGFNPIGHNNDNSTADSFHGTFDGAGFTLSNLTINRSAEAYIGVFGYSTGTIKDITVDSVDITGNNRVAGLVGQNDGTIANSSSSGSVIGNTFIGGFVGNNYGTIDNSSSSGSVVSVSNSSNIGGFVGINYGTIDNSSSSGSVVGDNNVGGFVGSSESESSINNSISSGSIVGNTAVGGFVGIHFSASYMGNTWCKLADSSLSAIGNKNVLSTEIDIKNENCE